ncbi:hypothetical protein N656DRAFT_784941 [Canariomyces notabilis]|uniref:Secreted protein n=1 Tax=Canariomyces notabilis TaxID=2074819 RepID=A0AAN6QGG5_9PEZI|nr:hypothetical protein N656DRAFT_784941 [Canariomyces arenarius]
MTWWPRCGSCMLPMGAWVSSVTFEEGTKEGFLSKPSSNLTWKSRGAHVTHQSFNITDLQRSATHFGSYRPTKATSVRYLTSLRGTQSAPRTHSISPRRFPNAQLHDRSSCIYLSLPT